jgi:type I restriction enzyme, S subunit
MMNDEMNQPFVELQDICRFISGGTPSTKVPKYFMGTIPWITGADMNGNVITKARQYITEEAIQNSATNIVSNGNILLVTRTGVGKVAIAGVDICISQDFTGLELDKTKVDEWYLLYYLRSQEEALTSQQRGATIQGITRDVVETLKIPLPPLTEQKRIASLLARADRLRTLRRTAHELGESLLQSVFLEMFGDPIENTNHWEMVELSDVAKKITDGEHLTPKTLPTGLPIVMAQQVEASGVNLADCKFVSEEDFRKFTRKCKPEFGDLLLVSRGATIGRSCVVNTHEPFCLMGSVILIKPDGKTINSKFLGQIFKNSKFQEYIRGTSNASAQQAIYVAPVAERKIILPPLSLQEEFAGVVARVESLRGRMSEAGRQVKGLFESLLSESFG